MALSSRADARSWPNGFSTMTRAPSVQPDLRELLDDRAEQRRRDREVVRGTRAAPSSLRIAVKRRGVVVVAVDVAQQAARACRTPPHRTRRASRRFRVRARWSCSRLHPAFATPMTGTSSVPRFTIACSDGKIFLYARSPVAPKNTSASDGIRSCVSLVLARSIRLPVSRRARRTRSASPTAACPGTRPRRAS